jgi:hypothetical protein
MAMGISNRRAGFQIWKVFGLKLYFDGTRAYTAVARSFATFGGSYAPAIGDGDIDLVAGLAVGKRGDTSSITAADSALGRSSVITGTTAGVTQFSEVSQITD